MVGSHPLNRGRFLAQPCLPGHRPVGLSLKPRPLTPGEAVQGKVSGTRAAGRGLGTLFRTRSPRKLAKGLRAGGHLPDRAGGGEASGGRAESGRAQGQVEGACRAGGPGPEAQCWVRRASGRLRRQVCERHPGVRPGQGGRRRRGGGHVRVRCL